jgi:hypothetical protein
MIRAAVAVVIALGSVAACKRESAPPNEGTTDQLPPVKPLPNQRPATPGAAPFALAVHAPPAEAGKPVVATVAVTPAAGYHVNTGYPTQLTFAPAAGITTPHAKQTATEATHLDRTQLAFGVELTCAAAGPHKLTGELSFAVCNDDNTGCLPQTTPVEVAVTAK